MFVFNIGKLVLLAPCERMTLLTGKDALEDVQGTPLAELLRVPGPGAAKRKKKKKTHAGKTARGRQPVGDCKKCGRVFFVPQGMSRHIKFCKGTKGEK
jgi:hypothetical protein